MATSQSKKIYIFRHGETDWNREGRFQGHSDIPLNDTGRSQAQALIPLLKKHTVEVIVSSDLSRAWETAKIVSNTLDIPLLMDSDLREAHLGEAQGLLFDEIEKKFGPQHLKRWRSSLPTDADIAYTGGETGKQVTERAFRALSRLIWLEDFHKIGVSTHGGVIRRIAQRLMPDAEPIPIPNGVLYGLDYDSKQDRWTLRREL